MKRIIVLMVVLAFVLQGRVAFAQQDGDTFTLQSWMNCTYRISSAAEKTVALVEIRYYNQDYDIEIPASVEYNNTTYTVTELDLRGNITELQKDLVIQIPNTVTSIGDECFSGRRWLKSIDLPSSLKKIGRWAFANTSLTSLELPEGLEEIGLNAFQAHELKEIFIPKNVEHVAGCLGGNLETIHVDEENPTYDSRGGCNAIIHTASNTLTAGCWGTTVPAGITKIGDNAFYDVSFYEREFSLPDGITEIGEKAFSFCQFHSPSFSLPQSVETIGGGAFNGSDIANVPTSGALKSVGPYAFSYTRVKEVEIKPEVDYGVGAFRDCWLLRSVHLDEGVTKIADRMFMACDSLSEVKLPQSLQRIGHMAFAASNIKTVEGLSSYRGELGAMAFNACDSLGQISLPADHSLYRTSDDGKVIYTRQGELLTLLPSVRKLVIPYPATGILREDISMPMDTAMAQYVCPLNCGNFVLLDTLELPCTWKAPVMREGCLFKEKSDGTIDYASATAENRRYYIEEYYGTNVSRIPALFLTRMKQLRVRTAEPFPFDYDCFKAGLDSIAVFSYAANAFQTHTHNEGVPFEYCVWRRILARCYASIDLPYSEMYVQEAIPALGDITATTDDGLVYWTADWRQRLETAYPEYFAAESPERDLALYRNFWLNRYLTPKRLSALCSPSTEVACLDGVFRISDRFDPTDYLRWFAQPDTLPADQYAEITSCTLVRDGDGWRTELSSTSNPRLQYALKMLPGIPYNIYMIAAPLLNSSLAPDEQPKSKLRATLSYLEGTRSKSQQSANMEILYSGEAQPVLLFENAVVENDDLNYIRIESNPSSRELRDGGFTREIALVGVVAVAQQDIVDGISVPVSGGQQAPVEYYDLSGRRLPRMQKGVNLLRLPDGSTRKVLLR